MEAMLPKASHTKKGKNWEQFSFKANFLRVSRGIWAEAISTLTGGKTPE